MRSSAALLPLLGGLAAALPVANEAPAPFPGEGIAARQDYELVRTITVTHIVDLPTITVKPPPGTKVVGRQEGPITVTDIVDLPTVVVRPLNEGIAARQDHGRVSTITVTRIVDLPTITVRPPPRTKVGARQEDPITVTETVTLYVRNAPRQVYDQVQTVTEIVNMPTMTVKPGNAGKAARQVYDQVQTVTEIVNMPTVTVKPGNAGNAS